MDVQYLQTGRDGGVCHFRELLKDCRNVVQTRWSGMNNVSFCDPLIDKRMQRGNVVVVPLPPSIKIVPMRLILKMVQAAQP